MHELWYGEAKVAKDMSKEQLETKFEFGITYLNLGFSSLASNGFKLKEYLKKKDPYWPTFMDMFGQKSLEILNMRNCQMNKNDMELLSNCLYNEIENFPIA